MPQCRECRPHIHEEMYWWCRLDEPYGSEDTISSDLQALVVSSGFPYAYVRESLDKKGRPCKPHWHFWVKGFRCELREWCRQYATAGGYMVKLADTQQADCAQGIVNYCAKTGAEWKHDGLPDDVIENGLKTMEAYRKERVSIYRQLDNLIPDSKVDFQVHPSRVIDIVLDFFKDRDMFSSYNTWKTYSELFILKRCGGMAKLMFKERLINDIRLLSRFLPSSFNEC